MSQIENDDDIEAEEIPDGQGGLIQDLYPQIASSIQRAAKLSSAWVSREEIIYELLLESDTRNRLEIERSKTGMSLKKYAGNIVDWWSSDFTKKTPEFMHLFSKFAREKIDKKWAYWDVSLGSPPRIRKVWIRSQPGQRRSEFESEIQNNTYWNLWPTKMQPYNDIEIGDFVVTAWNEEYFGKKGKMLSWVSEIKQISKSKYESIDDAFSILTRDLENNSDRLTRKEFISHPYTQGATESGYVLAYVLTPKFLLDQPRPDDLDLARNGWKEWSETALHGLRFEGINVPAPRVWQVNNNQEAEWETASGLLFAPTRGPNGEKRVGYDNLKEAKCNDIVYSMAGGYIRARGTVIDPPRVLELGQESGGRTGPGYELRVDFQRLRLPFRPKEYFDEIKEMMNPDMTQLTVNGDARQPTYFAEIARSHGDVYDDIIRRTTTTVGANRHVLFRLSGKQGAGAATIDGYRKVLAATGKVALIKIGAPIAENTAQFYDRLLRIGKQVSVFLLSGSDEKSLFEANLVQISNDPLSVVSDLIPDFHSEHIEEGRTCFVLDKIESKNLFDQLDDLLVLDKDPVPPISESLKGQQSVMNVLKISTESLQPVKSGWSKRIRELAHELTWQEGKVSELLEGLEQRRHQIILTGPPGTGKTFCAEKIAEDLLKASNIEDDPASRLHVVQFHPTYSYQEFIEGLQPEPVDTSFKFKWVDGVLKKIVTTMKDLSRDGKSTRQVLIIDEINRANVPSVLGELMYLLEYRDKNMTLGSGEKFSLPKELIIIGTMNSADRSIRGLDLALRRRFDFFEVDPDGNILLKFYGFEGKGKLTGMTIEQLVGGFNRLNMQIKSDSLTADLMIGHSYFMEKEMNWQVLDRVWRQQLKPLIREYFLGSPDITEKYSIEKFWVA